MRSAATRDTNPKRQRGRAATASLALRVSVECFHVGSTHRQEITMRWNTPDFEEINLSGEVTAYANTDEEVRAAESRRPSVEPAAAEQLPVAT